MAKKETKPKKKKDRFWSTILGVTVYERDEHEPNTTLQANMHAGSMADD